MKREGFKTWLKRLRTVRPDVHRWLSESGDTAGFWFEVFETIELAHALSALNEMAANDELPYREKIPTAVARRAQEIRYASKAAERKAAERKEHIGDPSLRKQRGVPLGEAIAGRLDGGSRDCLRELMELRERCRKELGEIPYAIEHGSFTDQWFDKEPMPADDFFAKHCKSDEQHTETV